MPYSLLMGNTSIIPAAATSGTLGALFARLEPQQVLPGATALVFPQRPNDIAVRIASVQAVPTERAPKAEVRQVACDHVAFFSSNVGQQAPLAAWQPT